MPTSSSWAWKITCVGSASVDEEDKPVLYRNAETFVFPSRYEGFGLGPLEAMSCGTPVVTTNSASLPEVVGPAAFTVDADDGREMAGAIIATVIEENLRADLRQKGLRASRKILLAENSN